MSYRRGNQDRAGQQSAQRDSVGGDNMGPGKSWVSALHPQAYPISPFRMHGLFAFLPTCPHPHLSTLKWKLLEGRTMSLINQTSVFAVRTHKS